MTKDLRRRVKLAGALTGMAVATLLVLAGCDTKPAAVGDTAVSMRRLTDQQYRNTIADIFGPTIKVNGRFEPIVRPTHHLLARGANGASISPAGAEQFDAMARGIAEQVFDEKRRAGFVPCAPQDEAKPDDACARTVLLPLGRYLFRRPLTTLERDLYVKTAKEAAEKTGSFYDGLQLALAAMLVAPDFLYIVETAEPDPKNPGHLRLDNYTRAARLSFVLWNTTPNDALLDAAEKGQLTDDAKLQQIATEMASSPRLEDGARAFFSDMLVFEKFEDMTKDPVIYPLFSIAVAKALPEQMLRTIVDETVTRGGDYRELFTTRHTFMTRNLALLYGAPLTDTHGWQPYDFPADSDRAGLVGQAAFMALYSHPGRSSATLRGRAVRELLLCQPVPDPPGNVDFKVVQDTNNTVLRTARARLEAHRDNPICAGCHKITDTIGLSLEQIDGSGASRMQENGADIDASGQLDGKPFSGAAELGQQLAENPATTSCVASRAIEYATGRDVNKDDAARIEKAFADSGYRLRTLFQEVVATPQLYVVPGEVKSAERQDGMLLASGNGEAK